MNRERKRKRRTRDQEKKRKRGVGDGPFGSLGLRPNRVGGSPRARFFNFNLRTTLFALKNQDIVQVTVPLARLDPHADRPSKSM